MTSIIFYTNVLFVLFMSAYITKFAYTINPGLLTTGLFLFK